MEGWKAGMGPLSGKLSSARTALPAPLARQHKTLVESECILSCVYFCSRKCVETVAPIVPSARRHTAVAEFCLGFSHFMLQKFTPLSTLVVLGRDGCDQLIRESEG